MMRWPQLFLLLILAVCSWWLYDGIQKPRFHPKELYSTIPKVDPSLTLPEEIALKLNQPFHLIGEGSQMYAFRSADGKIVLKLFKAHHSPHRSLLKKWLRAHRSSDEILLSHQKWNEKFAKTCACYLMAFKDLKEETGLCYLHFEKSSDSRLNITLLDASKKAYRVNLNNHPFIIQRHAELVPDYLKTLIESKQMDLAQSAVTSLKELFLHRTEKGYIDDRQSLRINYGFIDGKAVQIDVGKIKKTDLSQTQTEEELMRLQQRLDRWIYSYFPMLNP